MSVACIFITFRPRTGFQNVDVDLFIKKIKNKNYLGAYAVLEKKSNERHLHCVVWFHECIRMRDYRRKWERVYRHLWASRDDSLWTIACRQKTVYNDDVYAKYLRDQIGSDGSPKGDPVTVILDEVPGEVIRAIKCSDPKQKEVFSDPWFAKLERMFWEWRNNTLEQTSGFNDRQWEMSRMDMVSIEMCQKFLIDQMYNSRNMVVVRDPRKYNFMKNCLFNYLTYGRYFGQNMKKNPHKLYKVIPPDH